MSSRISDFGGLDAAPTLIATPPIRIDGIAPTLAIDGGKARLHIHVDVLRRERELGLGILP